MTLSTFSKDPDERLDYDIDFSRWLSDDDKIVSAVATIGGGTALLGSVEPSDTVVRVWVSAGTPNETNTITVRATTQRGRIKEAAIRLKIRGTV